MKLSNRLQSIYDLVPKNTQSLADVGTDHGQLIIKLILDDKIEKAFGLDIASGPLAHAKTNVENYGLTNNIKLIQTDGLIGFEEDVDTIVIAGMGGDTIWHIIDNYHFKQGQTLIVQSNTKIPWLRTQFMRHDFKIIDEKFIIENKKPIFIMKLVRDTAQYSNFELELGPILIQESNRDYISYLTGELKKLKKIEQFNYNVKPRIEIIKTYLEEVSNYERNNKKFFENK